MNLLRSSNSGLAQQLIVLVTSCNVDCFKGLKLSALLLVAELGDFFVHVLRTDEGRIGTPLLLLDEPIQLPGSRGEKTSVILYWALGLRSPPVDVGKLNCFVAGLGVGSLDPREVRIQLALLAPVILSGV